MPENIAETAEPSQFRAAEKAQPAEQSGLRDFIEKLFNRDYPDKKAVESVANAVASGKIEHKDEVAGEALKAFRGQQTNEFERAVNKKLEEMNSPYKIKIDDSFAGIQDIGNLSVDLIEKESGKVVDRCGTAVDNSPRVPEPPFDKIFPEPERKPDELPSDWPRLDIFEPPSKRK